MKITIAEERRHDGVARMRLTLWLRRSHWTKAKRYREGCASKSDAEKRKRELLKLAEQKGVEGVCDAVWGAEPKAVGAVGGLLEHAAEYEATKDAAGRRDRTITNIRDRLAWLARRLGDVPVASVGAADLQRLLNGSGLSARSRINHALVWRAFFRWCVRRGYCERDPMAGVELPSDPRRLPAVASPWQVARLVAAAWHDGGTRRRPGPMLGYVLLTFYSGVRPDQEAANLAWEGINFERGTIALDETATKVSRIRYVRMMPELTAVLKRLKKLGHAQPAMFSRRKWRRIRRRAGLESGWVVDIGRHTYASATYALTHDEADLTANMGNSVTVLRRNYLNKLVTRDQAERWRRVLATVAKRVSG